MAAKQPSLDQPDNTQQPGETKHGEHFEEKGLGKKARNVKLDQLLHH